MPFVPVLSSRAAKLCRARLFGTAIALALSAPAFGAPPVPPPAFAVCSTCHATEPGKSKIGPSLAGVTGRRAGSLDGFVYSTALKNSGLVWDAASLDRFIAAPASTVPGTRMTYAGLKDPQRRSEVIGFLLGLHN